MLTEQTLQSLKDLLKEEISDLENYISAIKDYIKVMYNRSTPDTEEGREAFLCLNEERNNLRRLQKDLKRLQNTQKAIKKELAEYVFINRDVYKCVSQVLTELEDLNEKDY